MLHLTNIFNDAGVVGGVDFPKTKQGNKGLTHRVGGAPRFPTEQLFRSQELQTGSLSMD